MNADENLLVTSALFIAHYFLVLLFVKSEFLCPLDVLIGTMERLFVQCMFCQEYYWRFHCPKPMIGYQILKR